MANTDLVTYVGNPGSATTLTSPGHTVGATVFNVVSTANWPTLSAAIFAVDTGTLQTVNGVPNVYVRNPGSYTEWEGDVTSSTTISNAVIRFGTDQNYPAGTLTRVYIPVASTRENRLAQAILVGHNQDGTHKAFTEASIVGTTNLANNAVTTAKVANTTVTPDKLNLGPQVSYVATSESRQNASYGALATASSVTATIGANGIAQVTLSVGNMFNNTTNGRSYMSFVVSGANTLAASDANSISVLASAGSVPQVGLGSTFTLTGLTPGSTTFTTVFRSLGTDTATFVDRRITVLPL